MEPWLLLFLVKEFMNPEEEPVELDEGKENQVEPAVVVVRELEEVWLWLVTTRHVVCDACVRQMLQINPSDIPTDLGAAGHLVHGSEGDSWGGCSGQDWWHGCYWPPVVSKLRSRLAVCGCVGLQAGLYLHICSEAQSSERRVRQSDLSVSHNY